jgi:hypothetical protein
MECYTCRVSHFLCAKTSLDLARICHVYFVAKYALLWKLSNPILHDRRTPVVLYYVGMTACSFSPIYMFFVG